MKSPRNSAWGGGKPIPRLSDWWKSKNRKKKEVDSQDENQMAEGHSKIEEGSMNN